MQQVDKFYDTKFSNSQFLKEFEVQVRSAALCLNSSEVKSTSDALFALYNSLSEEGILTQCRIVAEAACNDLSNFMMNKDCQNWVLKAKLSELSLNKHQVPLELSEYIEDFVMYGDLIRKIGNSGVHMNKNKNPNTMDKLMAVSAVCQLAFCLLNLHIGNNEKQKIEEKEPSPPSSPKKKKFNIKKKVTSQTTSKTPQIPVPKKEEPNTKQDSQQISPNVKITLKNSPPQTTCSTSPESPKENKLKHKWQRKNENDEWEDVQVELSKIMEFNFNDNNVFFKQEIDGKHHIINLAGMTDSFDGKCLALQRVPFGRRFAWQFVGKSKEWWTYDVASTLMIEQNFVMGVEKFEIEIKGKIYTIDLVRMTQKRVGETSERKIQRIDLI